ncbi:SF1B family DNA helicase RecD2 [Metabacillus malikii]|uniref:ATP-dependent RecD2 DNA helicase n=1 Tax=Metabacillus malikii TaxID=1504265 RepID=A0ABT9ZGX0_9BACI|nr:ATP-dependent RecD-like DNA helicase [Metabacillus malikii]MDQ0231533.1 exodeoxyribonuclease V alpha subunit [Metabacillus malikii]
MQESADLFGEQERYVKGLIKVVIFHNDQNLYSVLKVRVHETTEEIDEKEITVTGYFPLLHEDEVYTFYGSFTNHPKFGQQFQTEHFRKELPQTKEGIIQYLSSDLFKGIGKKTAEAIVEKLGESAISKILENPSVLEGIPKINKEKSKQLAEALISHQGLERIMIALNQLGFGPQLAMKIYQVYKDETLSIIQANPYQLVQDVEGIGFVRADELGKQLGIIDQDPERIKAACHYNIETMCLQEGHVYLTIDQLVMKTKELLDRSQQSGIQEETILNEIEALQEENKIIVEDGRAYMPTLFYAEHGLAKNIKKVLEQTEYDDLFPESEFLLSLGQLEERMNVQYAPSQKDAIQKALMSPMLLLTGGPGTGKTTVIKGIVELYADLHGCSLNVNDYKKEEPFPIVLVAPTGRAAKRMSEATGMPAVTIHRLLKWNGADGFEHGEDNPIAGKLIIIDEVSMVDIWIANQLFKALPENIQVIMVGDEDQLPSVGPGQVLKDLLSAQIIPTVRLTDIYRQAEGSSIIELAHDIKNGTLPANIVTPTADRSFIQCTQAQMKEVIEKVINSAIRKGYSAKDIQILAPMYRGSAGIDQLNLLLQELFNPKAPNKREIKYGEIVYRNGDKILQLVNQPDSNVFNGDIGEIVSIFYAKENTEKEDMIVVSFDGNEVTYTKQDFNQFTHAFCCSIHKSQGSEFPIVVLPIVKGYFRMLRRNLIYTAITRSKRSLVLCGEKEALKWGISNNDSSERQTSLMLKLIGVNDNPIDDELQKELPFPLADANIGMENITPYDFME